MALEMKVYQDPHRHEPKVFAGLTPRQLQAVPLLVIFAGGTFALVSLLLTLYYAPAGSDWSTLFTAGGVDVYGPAFDAASDVGFIAALPVALPIAAWGWWRPKGLRPETYIRYVAAHHFTGKVIPHVDSQPQLHDASDRRRSSHRRRDARNILARERVAVRPTQRCPHRHGDELAGA